MSDSTTISVRVTKYMRDRLENLARETKRSKSSLAAGGIGAFVDLEERQIAGIKKAMASIEAGRGVSDEDVAAWIASWDTEDERPTPTAE